MSFKGQCNASYAHRVANAQVDMQRRWPDMDPKQVKRMVVEDIRDELTVLLRWFNEQFPKDGEE